MKSLDDKKSKILKKQMGKEETFGKR